MAIQAKAIKQKIKGVGNIKKITRTMEMVSVSKMKKSTASALMVRPYAVAIKEALSHIGSSVGSEHIYFKPGSGSKQLYIVSSSNKGLCGSYNTNVYRKLARNIKEKNIENIDFVSVGKQSEKIIKRLGGNTIASFIEFSDIPGIDIAEEVFKIADAGFKSQIYSDVHFIYTHFVKQMSYVPTVYKILPVSTDLLQDKSENSFSINGSAKETIIEPNKYEVLRQIVPELLKSLLHTGLIDSSASEHSSRMFAMKTASDNAKEMQRILTISYNRARQDAVTQELAEIAAGAGAVSS